MKEIFSSIAKGNLWSGTDSVSGTGSDLRNTIHLRRIMPLMLRALDVKILTDAPCGDFVWMSKIDISGLVEKYYGFDIVDDLIDKNNKKHSNESTITFGVANICEDILPESDLIFCRDCLGHLSDESVVKALNNFRASKSKWVAITHFIGMGANHPIIDGSWRPVNAEVYPFNLGSPTFIFMEHSPEASNKSISIWPLNN